MPWPPSSSSSCPRVLPLPAPLPHPCSRHIQAFRFLTDAVAGIEFKTTIVTVSNAKRLLQALLMVLGVIYLVQLSKVKRRDSGL